MVDKYCYYSYFSTPAYGFKVIKSLKIEDLCKGISCYQGYSFKIKMAVRNSFSSQYGDILYQLKIKATDNYGYPVEVGYGKLTSVNWDDLNQNNMTMTLSQTDKSCYLTSMNCQVQIDVNSSVPIIGKLQLLIPTEIPLIIETDCLARVQIGTWRKVSCIMVSKYTIEVQDKVQESSYLFPDAAQVWTQNITVLVTVQNPALN